MTPEELGKLAAKEQKARSACKHRVNVCCAAGCASMNSDKIKDDLQSAIKEKGIADQVQVRSVGCMGLCAAGPLVSIESEGKSVMYKGVTDGDVSEVVESLEGKPIERLNLPTDMPFFARQEKIVLENCGVIDPERIEDYIAVGGYAALIKALTEMTPAGVVGEITRSGLRGRGGAGYPTGLKWGTVAKSPAREGRKYIVCNADEGDPGAFMDRSVLESDPHRVLEGMAIAAYAVGATHGFLYVRAEYPLAIKRLKRAISQAQKIGVLGANILSTTFSFNLEIRLGAGAFVCGEETALIASIEGNRGQPRPRPPYPAEFGLWGCPTLINNVETFANIAPIVDRGFRWFASIGTDKSKGTKVFALAGKIENTGLVEVPMGIKLRDIIEDIGGGIPDGGKFKAVQTGGPSGGCIPKQYMDMPIDYESVKEAGSIMGSGGMIVMDESSSMVDVAKYFMEFCKSESCGKCVPCRVGTAQMYDLLEKIHKGEGASDDLAMLESLCELVSQTSLCGLGQTAPNPVLSTLRYFRHEYLELLRDGQKELAAAGADKGKDGAV
ncbi:MAG: NADH-quinone oxidoreductase subunit NuoF [Phycisphaeraceae bacterium]|nr:NADH-quinone oxidoreductase subunit NuoF [Phycisphaeraceae bacterium]